MPKSPRETLTKLLVVALALWGFWPVPLLNPNSTPGQARGS
jgi:hypothetical protein